MKKLASITLVAVLATGVAHAETWRYVDTIDYGVQVHVDTDSITPAELWSNRRATIATAYPKGEAVLITLEVNCEHKTLKTGGKWYATKPNMHGGRLVKTICTQPI